MSKRQKYSNIKARDCRQLGIRLPDDVIARLDEISNGLGPREFLTQYALSIAGHVGAQQIPEDGNKRLLQTAAKCAICKNQITGSKTKKYCSQACKSKAKRAKKAHIQYASAPPIDSKVGKTSNDVLCFIRDYRIKNHGLSPTLRAICAGLGLSSTSVASYYIRALMSAGLIGRARIGKKHHSLFLLDGSDLPTHTEAA